MKELYVIVACEESGTVRRAFEKLGHCAWSCDLKPASDGGAHIQGYIQDHWGACRFNNHNGWDLMICHPPCTYLSVSAAWAYKDPNFLRYPGVGYHMMLKPGTLTGAARRKARAEAVQFAKDLMGCEIPKIAMENPVGNLSTLYRRPDQIIQPWMFGDDASKATCLWLKGLPKLKMLPPDQCALGREVEWPKGSGNYVTRWSNQTDGGQNKLTPSEGRAAERAVTYPGIAAAMAAQWGSS